jgi:hypothetical protein
MVVPRVCSVACLKYVEGGDVLALEDVLDAVVAILWGPFDKMLQVVFVL